MRTKVLLLAWLFILLLSIRLGVKYLKMIEPAFNHVNYHYQIELNSHVSVFNQEKMIR
jgi:hypothetical protein